MATAKQVERHSLSETGAFMRFLAMGETRTLPKLLDILIADGYKCHINKLRGWSSQHEWQAKAKEFDAQRAQAQQEVLFESAVEMDLRQAELGRMMQIAATQSIEAIMEAGVAIKPLEAKGFAEAGTRIERLAVGKATSRSEVTNYNTVVMPVLALFQQVVSGLPEQQRHMITRQFADGVNQIRDSILLESGATDVIESD